MKGPVRNIQRREINGEMLWGCNVWFGPREGATTHRRYYFRTRREAQNANISDESGVVATGGYLMRETEQE